MQRDKYRYFLLFLSTPNQALLSFTSVYAAEYHLSMFKETYIEAAEKQNASQNTEYGLKTAVRKSNSNLIIVRSLLEAKYNYFKKTTRY